MIKRTLFLIVSLIFAVSVSACGSPANNNASDSQGSSLQDTEVDINSGGDNQMITMEGAGFASPEEAITAYAKALKDQDLGSMISCFAIESYAANYDMAAEFMRRGGVFPLVIRNEPIAPVENMFMKDLNVEKRRGSVVDAITQQLLVLAYYNGGKEYDGASTIITETTFSYNGLTEQERYLDSYYTVKALQNIPAIEVGKVYEPYEVNEYYLNSVTLLNLRNISNKWHVDGIKSTAIQLDVSGTPYMLIMDAICYNGKWYLNCSSFLSDLVGVPSSHFGLTPYNTDAVTIEIKEWDWIKAKSEFATSDVDEAMAQWLDKVGVDSMQEAADFFAIPELAEMPQD